MLFQRGAGPSHILLLQEIRVHNSLVHGAQPIAHQKNFTFADRPGQGPGNGKLKESLPRKLCIAHESTDINGKYSCQTLRSSMSNGLHINHLMSSYVPLQKSSPSMFCPHFSKPYPSYLLVLLSTFGSTHIPKLTPPWTSPCLHSTEGGQETKDLLLHETQSPHNPHQQQSSSNSACERAAGVRQGAIHDRALNVLAVLFLGFLTAYQNATPCNTQLREEHGREIEKVAATS